MAGTEIGLTDLVRALNFVVRQGLGTDALAADESAPLVAIVAQIVEHQPNDPVSGLDDVYGSLKQVVDELGPRVGKSAEQLLGLAAGTRGTSVALREEAAASVFGIQGDSFRKLRRKQVLADVAVELTRRAAPHADDAGIVRRMLRQIGGSRLQAHQPSLVTAASRARTLIDPAEEPIAYAELLLGLVAGRDPTRVQLETIEELQQVALIADDRLRWKPSEVDWSAIEVVGHLADSEINAAFRYRIILAHSAPFIPGYQQEEWVRRGDHQQQPLDTTLNLFVQLRLSNISLWARTSEEDRERFGMHEERGPETLDTVFRMQAGHDLMHLTQIGEVLAAAPQ